MKRRVGLILFFVAVLAFCAHAADTRTVHIDALKLRIDVPASYTAITRDSDHSDPVMGQYIADTQQWMAENDYYLILENADPCFGCFLSARANPIERIDLFDDAALEVLIKEFRADLEASGFTISSSEVIRTEQTAFFRFDGSRVDPDGQPVFVIMYMTAYDFQTVILGLKYSGAEMPERCRTLGEELIAGLRFGEDDDFVQQPDPEEAPAQQPEPDSGPAQQPDTYLDEATGASFTVPAGWVRVDTAQDPSAKGMFQPVATVGFVRSDDLDVSVQYESYDIIGSMPKLIRKLLPRGEFNQSRMTVRSIEAGLPYNVINSEKQTINGREYFVIEYAGSKKEDTTEPKGTIAIFLQDGCYHVFRFTGTSDHPRYEEFRSMLGSADFPAIAPAEGQAQDTPAARRGFRVGFILGRIAVLLLIVGIVVGVSRRNRKKRARPTAGSAQSAPAAPDASATCPACGADLAPGETVCPYCGTKAE